MYERFTDRARNIIVRANGVAYNYGQIEIKPEHILIGFMFQHKGKGVIIIQQLVEPEKIFDGLDKRVQGIPQMRPTKELPYSRLTRILINNAQEYAQSLQHDYVGIEHIGYGILTLEEGITHEIFSELKLSKEEYDRKVRQILSIK